MSNGVNHLQDSGIGKANRGPTILPVVLTSVIGFDPPLVVKNKLGILEGNAVFSQVSCRPCRRPIQIPSCLCCRCALWLHQALPWRLMRFPQMIVYPVDDLPEKPLPRKRFS